MRNKRRVAGLTVEELASMLARFGLGKSTSRVAEIERGDFASTIETLHVVAGALAHLSGEPMTIADLIPGDADIALTNTLTIDGGTLADELRGVPVELPERAMPGANELRTALDLQQRAAARPRGEWPDDEEVERENDAAEVVLRAVDGLTRADLRVLNAVAPNDLNRAMLASLDLWGRLPADERDARAPDGANPQKLGRITRQLADELADYIGRRGSRSNGET